MLRPPGFPLPRRRADDREPGRAHGVSRAGFVPQQPAAGGLLRVAMGWTSGGGQRC
jgi:hypothetical protein